MKSGEFNNKDIPIVFSHTETAAAGEVIGIQGGSFGLKPELWLAIPQHNKVLKPQRKLTVVSASDRNIAALLPDAAAFGKGKLLVLWVKNRHAFSRPFYLNRARVVSVEFQEIMSGQHFRIFGRNLSVPGFRPRVRFVNRATGESEEAKFISGNQYILELEAPDGLTPERHYQLRVSNGNGNHLSEVLADETLLAQPVAADPFELKVPWASGFTFAENIYNVRSDARLNIKALGNGVSDDRDAIQAAIDKASSDGGGVVYLPEGRYRIEIPSGSGLTMRSKVVLKGEGPEKSVIQYGFGTPPPYPDVIGKDGWPNKTTAGVALLWPLDVELSGLYNLGVQNVNQSGRWRHSMKTMPPPEPKPGAGGSRFFARNCRFDLDVAWGLSWGHVDRFVITECFFESKARITWPWMWHCNGATNFVIRKNIVKYGAGRFGFNDSYNGIIENNHITRRADLANYKGETGGFNIDFASDIVIMNNTLDVEGGTIENHNQGETILSQGCNPEHMNTGSVTSANLYTLQDSTQRWGKIRTASLGSSDAVAIVEGKGTGQWRRIISNSETELKLDRPWDIVPDPGSHYVIMRWSAEDWLVLNNTLNDNNRGIWFYCGNTDVAIVGNRLRSSEGIYLRADQRLLANRYNLSWNTLVADNSVISTNGLRPAYICNVLALGTKPDTLFGLGSSGVEIRRNLVSANRPNTGTFVRGEGYFNEVLSKNKVSGSTGIRGTIFENNTAIYTDIAYRLNDPIDQTIIRGAINQHVKTYYTPAKGTVILSSKPDSSHKKP